MMRTFLRTFAGIGALLLLAAVMLWPVRAEEAPSCTAAKQFAPSVATAREMEAAGKVDYLVVVEGMAEVDALLAAIGGSYNVVIPAGKADAAIGVMAGGRFILFGYLNGCQVGHVVLGEPPSPATPKMIQPMPGSPRGFLRWA